MRAKIIGFELDCDAGVTFEDVFAGLIQRDGKQHEFAKQKRLIYVDETSKCYIGLLFSLKDQRRDLEVIRKAGKFSVNIREIEEGANLADFNFFAIHKTTLRGVYQHYRGSCSINRFGLYLKDVHDDIRNERKQDELQKVPEGTRASSHAKNVRKKYKGHFDYHVLYLPDDFDDLIDSLNKVSEFDFSATTLSVPSSVFSPLADELKSQKIILRFDKKSKTRVIKQTLKSAVQVLKPDQATVRGKSSDGLDCVYKLLNNPSVFGDEDYDNLAHEEVLKVNEIEKSTFIKRLTKIIDNNPLVFGKRK